MKISRIAVHGLFDRFNHILTFDPCERITIMIGPNGYGKTTILRILNTLFNLSPRALSRMPFKELYVDFDDGSGLTVVRTTEKHSPRLFYVTPEQETEQYFPETLDTVQEVSFPLRIVEDIVPVLERIGASQWRNVHTSEIFELDDVLETYADILPSPIDENEQEIPSWLEEIRASLPVRFIDTERLTDLSTHRRLLRSRSSYSYVAPDRTVRLYSEKLAHMVQETLTEYANLSQALDRSFRLGLWRSRLANDFQRSN